MTFVVAIVLIIVWLVAGELLIGVLTRALLGRETPAWERGAEQALLSIAKRICWPVTLFFIVYEKLGYMHRDRAPDPDDYDQPDE